MKKIVNHIVGCTLVIGLMVSSHSLASELTVPNQFSSGDVTSASDVNANFAAIEAAVNDNHARIQEGLQSQSRPVFVGFSEPVHGESGFNSWQQVCHNISAGSHVCTDVELAEAPYNPEAPITNDDAWIYLDMEEYIYESGSNRILPESRLQGCNTSGYGFRIQNGKASTAGTCNTTKAVACCK